MNTDLKVLIVDDEPELRKSVETILTQKVTQLQFEFFEAGDGQQAVDLIKSTDFDMVFMDVRMPQMDGLEALKLIKAHDPKTFVVIMTAHANFQDAVDAIKIGAYDYIEKPIDPVRLTTLIKKALETREMVSSLAISAPIFNDDVETEFVGSSQKMREVFDLIGKLSHVDTTVLIRGENGTGKELVARAIHSTSPRKHGEFVAINCGAIPENLMESEFFGYEKGAFTGAVERKIGKFQVANKGTIFLDEIGELRPEMQVKLLRVLQERKFTPVGSHREVATNARIVAATNQNLEKMIEEGTFREDLFYRLNVMPIFLPPLRDRIEDLGNLTQYFIKRFNKKLSRQITGFSSESIMLLKRYSWPGNIRELENIIERCFIVEKNNLIEVSSLPEQIQNLPKESDNPSMASSYKGPMDFDQFKEATEKEFIIQALKVNQGRINQTVAHAGIPKNTLLRKIRKYDINVKDYTKD